MNTMSMTAPTTAPAALSLVTSSHAVEKRDEQTISDFAADLDAALRDLEQASKERASVSEQIERLQGKLKDRNWWGTFKAGFSGETDKGLADMVKELGSSLGLTQSVLRVMLKIQTEKNKLLRGFSNALVEKISKIQNDAHTLDGNQKQAAMAFLVELQAQIDEQMRQQDLVESHESRLQGVEMWRQGQDGIYADLVGHIEQMRAEALRVQQRLATVESDEIPALRLRLAALEAENQRLRTPKAVMQRNWLPIGASMIGTVALFFAMRA